MEAAQARQLEREHRRAGVSVPHPDAEPHLTFDGANFAVPPRVARARVRPTFGPGGTVAVAVEDAGAIDWPELAAFLAACPRQHGEPCPTCGRIREPVLPLDGDEGRPFLAAVFGLAARLLAVYYDLPADTLAELLAFDADGSPLPDWFGQLLRWAVN